MANIIIHSCGKTLESEMAPGQWGTSISASSGKCKFGPPAVTENKGSNVIHTNYTARNVGRHFAAWVLEYYAAYM